MSMTPPPFNGTPSPAATPPVGVPPPFGKAATPPPFTGGMGIAAESTAPAMVPASQPQASTALPAGEVVLPAAAASTATAPADIPESGEASPPGIEMSAAESSAPAASPQPIEEAASETPAGDNDSPRKRLVGIGAVCLVVAIGAGIFHVSSTKTAAEASTVPPAAAVPPPATAAVPEPPPAATPARPVRAAEAESAKAAAGDKSAKPVKPEAPAWLRSLRAELEACDKKSFPASGLCSEKARWKYCAPKHWDTVRECAVERRDL